MTGLLVAQGLAAGPAETGFIAQSQGTIDIAADDPAEDSLELDTWLRARAAGDLDGDRRWSLSLLGAHELRHGQDTDALWSVRPGESAWDGPLGPLRLRLGLLDNRWGRLDLLPVMDVLGARDLRFGPLVPPTHARVALAAATLSASGERWRAELVALPFSGADKVALIGSDWSIIRQGMLESLADDIPTWEGDAVSGPLLSDLISGLSQGLAASQDQLLAPALAGLSSGQGPGRLGESGEVAARGGLDLGRADLLVAGGTIRSRTPLLGLDPALAALLASERLPDTTELSSLVEESSPITMEFPRTWFAGLEGGALLGPVGLRAEGLWRSARPVSGPWLSTATSPALAAGAGLDWMPSPELALGFEASYERLLEAPESLLLDRAEKLHFAGFASARLWSERVEILVAGVYAASFREHLIRARAAWRVNDAVEIAAGGLVIGGGPSPAPDTLSEALTWQGGLFSYWGNNDGLTLSLAWIR